ncbi:MAG TPA: hypothetical protein VHM72_03355, partial [Solirubrobacteraceae bacterium]|nr:hypothetical protein [Solirubrobacteraceae bacterium]
YQGTGSSSDREVVLLQAANGSRLVVDRSLADRAEARLLAHLAADEPDENAMFVCREYMRARSRACRAPRASDLVALADGAAPASATARALEEPVLVNAAGTRYRLTVVGAPAELRWRQEHPDCVSLTRTVSAREVVAAIEDYEPVLALTRAAVSALRRHRDISIATLALELRRVESSPIVLNRRLREAVLEAVRQRGLSLSAIAIACGRMKRDPRGNGSGETSWLARRIGLSAEGTVTGRNPWVHSDTLALIARDGLGVAPREVELG